MIRVGGLAELLLSIWRVRSIRVNGFSGVRRAGRLHFPSKRRPSEMPASIGVGNWRMAHCAAAYLSSRQDNRTMSPRTSLASALPGIIRDGKSETCWKADFLFGSLSPRSLLMHLII